MKLLFDQNLSSRLPYRLSSEYPDSRHLRDIGLQEASDQQIWEYAKANGFAIVSKDSDFQHRSLLYGHPPKFIWLRVGNCPVDVVESVLRENAKLIQDFGRNETQSYLILPKLHWTPQD